MGIISCGWIRLVCFELIVALGCGAARAQFYAPETERHDSVQRFFPVEMARILGWFEAGKFPGITEIRYKVKTRPDGTTVWEIQWVNGENKELFGTTVEYPASLLESGPEFYRNVSLQVAKPNFQRPFHGIHAGDAIENYWKGASLLGLSREETFSRILELEKNFATDPALTIPEMAGALTHSALFSVADRLTIDSMTAARGAAMLALSERTSAEKFDDLWGPTLFIAGREKQAAEYWQKNHVSTTAYASAAQSGWNVWMRSADPRDLYRFALGTGHLAIGLPMLACDSQIDHDGETWAKAMYEGLKGSTLLRLHNYGPLLMWVSFSGGRMTEGAWTAVQRRDWIQLMTRFPGDPQSAQALEKAKKILAAKLDFNSVDDPSLAGLKEAAPLINLGRTAGVGPLAPTATLTERDVLNYGWEMTGLQLGARFRFVQYDWGVNDLANAIRSQSVAEIDGALPFFVNESGAKSATYRENLARLQLVDRLFLRAGWSENPFATKGHNNADVFVKRNWLRPRELEWQARSLWDANDLRSIDELFNYYKANGGPLAAAFALKYLGAIHEEGFKFLTNGPGFVTKFAAKLPYLSNAYIPAVYDQMLRGKDPFERSQLLERIYWEHPESELESRIFGDYAVWGAFKSAQRFYGQARPYLKDLSPVGLSRTLGRYAFVTGYLIDDAEMRAAALEDSNSGSHADMEIHIYDDLLREDFAKLRRDVADLVERYSETTPLTHPDKRLLAFMPLVEALKNPKDSRHNEAVRFFAGSDAWPIFRWICVDRFKLEPSEAVQFLGGKDAPLLLRGLVAYVEKDHAGMLEYVNRFNSRGIVDAQVILLQTLFDRLEGNTFTREQPDLKPKHVTALRDVVKDALANRKADLD